MPAATHFTSRGTCALTRKWERILVPPRDGFPRCRIAYLVREWDETGTAVVMSIFVRMDYSVFQYSISNCSIMDPIKTHLVTIRVR